MDERLAGIIESVVTGRIEQTASQVEAALVEGLTSEQIMDEGLIAAMTEVGKKFERGEFFVPEMLVAARAMEAGLTVIKPLLVSQKVMSAGVAIAGTVQGDLHDIGKNLVTMMLRGAGFEVIDLGTDVAPETFVQAVGEHNPDLIAMSALLTTTMVSMESTINALSEAGLRDEVKIMIGGAPVTTAFADQIGADGSAPDAQAAVVLAKQLMA